MKVGWMIGMDLYKSIPRDSRVNSSVHHLVEVFT